MAVNDVELSIAVDTPDGIRVGECHRVLDHVPAAMPSEVVWARDGAADHGEDVHGLVRVGSTWTPPTAAGPG